MHPFPFWRFNLYLSYPLRLFLLNLFQHEYLPRWIPLIATLTMFRTFHQVYLLFMVCYRRGFLQKVWRYLFAFDLRYHCAKEYPFLLFHWKCPQVFAYRTTFLLSIRVAATIILLFVVWVVLNRRLTHKVSFVFSATLRFFCSQNPLFINLKDFQMMTWAS